MFEVFWMVWVLIMLVLLVRNLWTDQQDDHADVDKEDGSSIDCLDDALSNPAHPCNPQFDKDLHRHAHDDMRD